MNFVQLESGRLIPTRDLRIDSVPAAGNRHDLAGRILERDRELQRLIVDHKDFVLTDGVHRRIRQDGRA